jgi:hypothetical protein
VQNVNLSALYPIVLRFLGKVMAAVQTISSSGSQMPRARGENY